jgi:tight adherence protein B
MTQQQIYVVLLFIISFSATILAYIFYIEYKRLKHLAYIKNAISLREQDTHDLLSHKEDTTSTIFLRLNAIITKAGFPFKSFVFILIFLIFTLLIGSLISLFLKHWSGYIIGIPLGILLFWMIISTIIAHRKKAFNKALATSISVLVKMMKNGIGFEQALSKSIAVSNSAMFKSIFETFFQEKNTIGEIEAFANLNRLVDSKELRIFALAIKIGRESGGQFSNTLEKVEHTISYREKMQEKVDVVTRESTVGSYVVVGITIFLYFSLNLNFDGKLHAYFMDSPWGRYQILGIALWVFTGILLNKFITRINK